MIVVDSPAQYSACSFAPHSSFTSPLKAKESKRYISYLSRSCSEDCATSQKKLIASNSIFQLVYNTNQGKTMVEGNVIKINV